MTQSLSSLLQLVLKFFVVVALCCAIAIGAVDQPVYAWVKELHTYWFGFFRIVTEIGESHWWLLLFSGLAIVLYGIGKQQRAKKKIEWCMTRAYCFLFAFVSMCVAGALLNILKFVIGRYRPRYLEREGLYGFEPFNLDIAMSGFPSGHSQAIWTAMVCLLLIFPRYALTYIGLASLVAVSRVMVGSHYVADIIMGSFIGIVVPLILHKIMSERWGVPRIKQAHGWW